VAEELLDLLDRHSALKQGRCDRMAQQVWIDALLDLRFLRYFLDDLLHAARRVWPVAVALKQVAGGSVSEMRTQFLRQVRQDGHIAALSPLGLMDQDHRFIKEEVAHANVNELRNARPGLE